MVQDFFCVDLIRSVLIENIAEAAVRGTSVKKSFTGAVEYVTRLTGMTSDEIAQFLPSEYKFAGAVVVGGKYQNFTVTKSRFELYPVVS